jgi:aspartyl-tRNA(Asn)/glutamyl-tRNA(Gln) amidotransferase subunit C
MKIDDKKLDHLAKLANLAIADEEREKLKSDMTEILSWVKKLEEVDTENIEPLIHMTQEINRVRDDDEIENLTVEETLQNAAVKKEGYFVVPKVIKKEND